MRRLFGALAFVVMGLGCSRTEPATAADLRARAAFELGCEDLTLVRIDRTTGGVAGCGRRVVYVERCDGDACRWNFEREVPPPPAWGYSGELKPAQHREPVTTSLLRAPPPNDEWRTRVPALSVDDPGF